MSYNLVPELQYWIFYHIISSKLNREKIKAPVQIPLSTIYEKSFINLLFDENYNLSSYEYLFIESTEYPNIVRNRIQIYNTAKYYIITNDTINKETPKINLFLLDEYDLLILNKLLQYRLDPENTNLEDIPFDTTAFDNFQSFPSDSTSFTNYDKVIPEITLQSINSQYSNLYNLIYLYLDFKINNNTQYYNNLILLSKNNSGNNPKEILECLFELFLIEEMFKYLSIRTYIND